MGGCHEQIEMDVRAHGDCNDRIGNGDLSRGCGGGGGGSGDDGANSGGAGGGVVGGAPDGAVAVAVAVPRAKTTSPS